MAFSQKIAQNDNFLAIFIKKLLKLYINYVKMTIVYV